MRREFMVERQGRSFCLYAGLLDLAHQQGLKSIRTELIQLPSKENNGVAVCMANVVLEKEGKEHVFTGIGDAAVNNVAPAMATCLIRMAETRSKARALRDAVNIGVAAFEELCEEDACDGAPERGYAMSPVRNVRQERPTMSLRLSDNSSTISAGGPGVPKKTTSALRSPKLQSSAADPATEAQIEAIRSLCRRRALEPDTVVKEKFDVEQLAALNQMQASEIIKQFNARPPAAKTPVSAAS